MQRFQNRDRLFGCFWRDWRFGNSLFSVLEWAILVLLDLLYWFSCTKQTKGEPSDFCCSFVFHAVCSQLISTDWSQSERPAEEKDGSNMLICMPPHPENSKKLIDITKFHCSNNQSTQLINYSFGKELSLQSLIKQNPQHLLGTALRMLRCACFSHLIIFTFIILLKYKINIYILTAG